MFTYHFSENQAINTKCQVIHNFIKKPLKNQINPVFSSNSTKIIFMTSNTPILAFKMLKYYFIFNLTEELVIQPGIKQL